MNRKISGPSVLASWRRLSSAATVARIEPNSRQPPTRPVRQGRGHAGERAGIRAVFGRAVKHVETRALANRVGLGRRKLGRQADQDRDRDAERGLFVLTDDQQIVCPLAAEQARESGP